MPIPPRLAKWRIPGWPAMPIPPRPAKWPIPGWPAMPIPPRPAKWPPLKPPWWPPPAPRSAALTSGAVSVAAAKQLKKSISFELSIAGRASKLLYTARSRKVSVFLRRHENKSDAPQLSPVCLPTIPRTRYARGRAASVRFRIRATKCACVWPIKSNQTAQRHVPFPSRLRMKASGLRVVAHGQQGVLIVSRRASPHGGFLFQAVTLTAL